jgi:hypothetical protein
VKTLINVVIITQSTQGKDARVVETVTNTCPEPLAVEVHIPRKSQNNHQKELKDNKRDKEEDK